MDIKMSETGHYQLDVTFPGKHFFLKKMGN